MRSHVSRCATDDLIEVALLAPRRRILIKQGETLFVELPEKVVPGDLLQRVSTGVARKIEPQNAGVALSACTANTSRMRATVFRPASDFVVICCDLRPRFTWAESPAHARVGIAVF